MNIWTHKSIELANQTNYLDMLYKVYPVANNLIRDISKSTLRLLSDCFNAQDNEKLVSLLLEQELFPIKDLYVAYLKRDKSAIGRNPKTINRLAGAIYEMGYEKVVSNISLPKEAKRQIGPLFRNWLKSGVLGVDVISDTELFLNCKDDCVLVTSDARLQNFAKNNLGYTRNKGLDFIGKFNNTYILAETKFLTDFGGHQDSQLEDAMLTLRTTLEPTQHRAKVIAVLDGVLYIVGNHKMHKTIKDLGDDEIVLSSLLLRDYLYSV